VEGVQHLVEIVMYIQPGTRVPRMNESYESSRHKSRGCSIVSGWSVAFIVETAIYV